MDKVDKDFLTYVLGFCETYIIEQEQEIKAHQNLNHHPNQYEEYEHRIAGVVAVKTAIRNYFTKK